MDVNSATRDDIVRVLMAAGVEGSLRDTIADSILDWRDANNFHRLNGAEDDYYGSLAEPYGSKDGPLDTIDELLWIKGVTPELFYGKETTEGDGEGDALGDRKAGLRDLFTVFTGSRKVNINTAPLEVLLSIPGMDEAAARSLMDAREEREIQDAGGFTAAGGRLAPGTSKYITFSSPGIYTIESRAGGYGTPVVRSLRAVVMVKDGPAYEILYWKDNELGAWVWDES